MKPRLTAITLGVDDLERSLAFYRDGLGLPTPGIVGTEFEHGAVAFFELEHGLLLALWERKNLAWETGISQTARSPAEFSLGHNVNSREEVDAIMEQAPCRRRHDCQEARNTFWGGYAGTSRIPRGTSGRCSGTRS